MHTRSRYALLVIPSSPICREENNSDVGPNRSSAYSAATEHHDSSPLILSPQGRYSGRYTTAGARGIERSRLQTGVVVPPAGEFCAVHRSQPGADDQWGHGSALE